MSDELGPGRYPSVQEDKAASPLGSGTRSKKIRYRSVTNSVFEVCRLWNSGEARKFRIMEMTVEAVHNRRSWATHGVTVCISDIRSCFPSSEGDEPRVRLGTHLYLSVGSPTVVRLVRLRHAAPVIGTGQQEVGAQGRAGRDGHSDRPRGPCSRRQRGHSPTPA